MDHEVDEDDLSELVEENEAELSTEEIRKLQMMQYAKLLQEISTEEVVEAEKCLQ